MSGDGALISALIRAHLRLPPAQVPALRMMRVDSDEGGSNDALEASSCGVAPTVRRGMALAGSLTRQHIAC